MHRISIKDGIKLLEGDMEGVICNILSHPGGPPGPEMGVARSRDRARTLDLAAYVAAVSNAAVACSCGGGPAPRNRANSHRTARRQDHSRGWLSRFLFIGSLCMARRPVTFYPGEKVLAHVARLRTGEQPINRSSPQRLDSWRWYRLHLVSRPIIEENETTHINVRAE